MRKVGRSNCGREAKAGEEDFRTAVLVRLI
jgi:hypothetical protein